MKSHHLFSNLFWGICSMLISGSIYAWSSISFFIQKDFPGNAEQMSFTFTVAMICFSIGGIASGMLSSRCNANWRLRITAALFLAGFYFSGSIHSVTQLHISFGLIAGFASGMLYNTIMVLFSNYYPYLQGSLSGILIFGFGLGGMLISFVFSKLITEYALDWRTCFVILAIVFCFVLLFVSFYFSRPTAVQTDVGTKHRRILRNVSPSQMMRHSSFAMFFIWTILLGLIAMGILSQSLPIAVALAGQSTQPAMLAAVSGLVSTFYGIGSVFWGYLIDKKRILFSLKAISVTYLISGLFPQLAFAQGSLPLLAISFVLLGFAFGGISPAISAFAFQIYGMRHYEKNLPIISSNLLISAFGSVLLVALHRIFSSYGAIFWIIAGMSLLSLLLCRTIDKSVRSLDRVE